MRNVNFTFWCTRQLDYIEVDLPKVCNVSEAVAKVENAMCIGRPWSGSSHRGRESDIPYKGRDMRSSASVQWYFSAKFGLGLSQNPPGHTGSKLSSLC